MREQDAVAEAVREQVEPGTHLVNFIAPAVVADVGRPGEGVADVVREAELEDV